MIPKKRDSIQVSYSKILFVYFSVLLLVIPFRLLIAAAVSAAVHELFHIAAIRVMRLPVNSIHIGVRGAKIHTQLMTDKQELICALSGPIGGLLLLLFFRWTPVISLCALVQSLYNLLPLYPTDGGRVLNCVTKMVFPQYIAYKVVHIAEILTLSAIIAICAYGSLWLRLGVVPLIFALTLLLQFAGRK